MVGVDALGDKVVIVDDIQDAVVPVVRTDVFDFVNPILRATDSAFEAKNMIH